VSAPLETTNQLPLSIEGKTIQLGLPLPVAAPVAAPAPPPVALVPEIKIEKKQAEIKPIADDDKIIDPREIMLKLATDLVSGLKSIELLSADFHERYVLTSVLGVGAFGLVLSAVSNETRQMVAVKIIIKSKYRADEVEILRGLDHPCIIKFIEVIIGEGYAFVITELFGTEWSVENPKLNPVLNPGLLKAEASNDEMMSSCDLYECITRHGSISEEICQKMMAQLASGVKYMKDKGFTHRDIKVRFFLLTRIRMKT
jgi:hypothetical protein